ncbi:MAG: hypothetical protein HY400_05270, partial [Elusimicrobia bacterium]|nr:hypothetical protein [Elusimicrobiota bacterium]
MKRLEYPAVILLFFYLACAFLLKPWSLDFPLNDDWVYTWAVQHLLEKGSIRLSEWGASTQVVQILWGALWTKILGWSLGSLKISTLVSAIGGAYFLNSILKLLDIPSYLRLLTVLLLAANPIYFCLSFTFMTDVPFLALMLLSSFLFMKAEGAAASLT